MMNIDTSTMVPFKKDVILHTPLSVIKKSKCCPRIRILESSFDKVLNILKDDNDNNNSNKQSESLQSPGSMMDTITTALDAVVCGDDYFSSIRIASVFASNDDTNDTTSRRSIILASTNSRDAQGQRCTMSSSLSAPPSKGIFFCPMVGIKDTLSRKDYTQEEKYNTFLQCDEFQDIQQREYLLFSRMDSLLKESYKLASYQEVFVEQERQEDEYECKCGKPSSSPFYYDDQAIANAYSKISKDCRIRAKEVALKIRQEVELSLHI
jgi:hypothetical protein